MRQLCASSATHSAVIVHGAFFSASAFVTLLQIYDFICITSESLLATILALVASAESVITIAMLFYRRLDPQKRHIWHSYLGPVLVSSVIMNLAVTVVIVHFAARLAMDAPGLRDIMQLGYGSPFYPWITSGWDRIQNRLECCGVDGSEDWSQSVWWSRQRLFPPLSTPSACVHDHQPAYSEGCYPQIRARVLLCGVLFAVAATTSSLAKCGFCRGLLDPKRGLPPVLYSEQDA